MTVKFEKTIPKLNLYDLMKEQVLIINLNTKNHRVISGSDYVLRHLITHQKSAKSVWTNRYGSVHLTYRKFPSFSTWARLKKDPFCNSTWAKLSFGYKLITKQ